MVNIHLARLVLRPRSLGVNVRGLLARWPSRYQGSLKQYFAKVSEGLKNDLVGREGLKMTWFHCDLLVRSKREAQPV